MKRALHPALVQPVDDLALLDPGAVLIEVEHPFDETFGDPAIHYFQVVERDGVRLTVAGIPKELIPGTEHEPDFRMRVRPVRDAFVRACSVCRDREPRDLGERDEGQRTVAQRLGFAAINAARWFAHDGPGALHDESSSAFDHVFADYVPTTTIDVHFADGEPYLTPQRPSTILCLDIPSDDLWRLGHV